MVSKEQYYARKEAGLCTKCGKTREGSPSKVRCLACHTKLQRPKGSAQTTASQKVEALRNNKAIDSVVGQKICQKCGEAVKTFNVICQKCIKTTVFTKYDAFRRYGGCCYHCQSVDLNKLKIVSSDISKSMQHKGQELYRLICYRRTPPDQYCIMCHDCYWQQNLLYIKQMRSVFDQKGTFHSIADIDDTDDQDILDI